MTATLTPGLARLAAAALLALVAATPVAADLGAATVTLTGEELQLVAENPALLRLGEHDPTTLRQVLDRMEAVVPSAGKGLTDVLKQDDAAATPAPVLPPEDQALVDHNPALGKIMRDSPEAALDLILLIKQASKNK